jgi:hypothetical protein
VATGVVILPASNEACSDMQMQLRDVCHVSICKDGESFCVFFTEIYFNGLVEKSTRVRGSIFVACDVITLGIAGSVNEERLMKKAIN